jgi:hypothetical protein
MIETEAEVESGRVRGQALESVWLKKGVALWIGRDAKTFVDRTVC